MADSSLFLKLLIQCFRVVLTSHLQGEFTVDMQGEGDKLCGANGKVLLSCWPQSVLTEASKWCMTFWRTRRITSPSQDKEVQYPSDSPLEFVNVHSGLSSYAAECHGAERERAWMGAGECVLFQVKSGTKACHSIPKADLCLLMHPFSLHLLLCPDFRSQSLDFCKQRWNQAPGIKCIT